jgi:hypothetical protein
MKLTRVNAFSTAHRQKSPAQWQGLSRNSLDLSKAFVANIVTIAKRCRRTLTIGAKLFPIL